ncbi:hypothetical protein GGR53DRAFT_463573 [Hypoxylon sp. FL1150]|nr:hypothetical protein GGR53DRAFT_463573 [Hypoxylon sp. FL1150]
MGQAPSKRKQNVTIKSLAISRLKRSSPPPVPDSRVPASRQSVDSNMAQIIWNDYPGRSYEDVPVIDLDGSDDGDANIVSSKQHCKDAVMAVLPDICHDFLEKMTIEHLNDSNAIIDAVLLRQENGESYPVRVQDNPLKRKRVDDDDDDEDDDVGDDYNIKGHEERTTGAAAKFVTETRAKIDEPHSKAARDAAIRQYTAMAVNLIATEYVTFSPFRNQPFLFEYNSCSSFPRAPVKVIRDLLAINGGLLFNAHAHMDDIIRNRSAENPGWKDKKYPSKRLHEFLPDQIHNVDLTVRPLWEKEAIAELRAARELSALKDADLAAEAKKKEEFELAKTTGGTGECGCCFEEFLVGQMIQCDGENIHLFCRGCMRSQAETNIGYSKHELTCMSMDGCEAGFSRAQRCLFLDKKLRIALDRIEQEAALRMAGIENLETCPFCPYAAEYPPAAVDKEFRCIRPGCEKVSCRLCRKESHIPKSCAEAALDHGLDARHELEEAMTAALVRICNKCKNPFLKSDGCNKIACTKCGTKQCYVCRKTITSYDHFNDVSRGGKKGQCPLFDNTEERHQDEVRRAEEEARRKVTEANPTVAAEALSLEVSKIVQQDDLRRKQSSHRPGYAAWHPAVPLPPQAPVQFAQPAPMVQPVPAWPAQPPPYQQPMARHAFPAFYPEQGLHIQAPRFVGRRTVDAQIRPAAQLRPSVLGADAAAAPHHELPHPNPRPPRR